MGRWCVEKAHGKGILGRCKAACYDADMDERARVIGIAGPSCSGKTTLARRLASTLPGGALVFELDWYYHDQSGHGIDDIDVDVPAAIDHNLAVIHLRRLAAGHVVERPDYDYHTHARARAGITIHPAPAIIVEGLFALYWEELRAVLDHGMFIEADHGVCLERRIARDTRERGRTAEQVKRQYREKVQPMFERYVAPTCRHAGLVLDGAGSVDDMIERAAAWLESQ